MSKKNLKQDRAYTRTAAALERKLGVKKAFSETMGAIEESRTNADVLTELVLKALSDVAMLNSQAVKKTELDSYISAVGEVQALELTEDFTDYDESSTPWCAKNAAGMVELWGIVSPTLAENALGSATATAIFTLPEGYRPVAEINFLCQGEGSDMWLLTVSTDGTVSASRYRNNAGYATPATTAWMPFHLMFMAK